MPAATSSGAGRSDRLGEITVPTPVLAGRDDFIFPPRAPGRAGGRDPNVCLRITERAGHNPHPEQPTEVMQAVRDFISGEVGVPAADTAAARSSR